VGAFALNDKSMLTSDILDNPKNMFMELVPENYDEYTVDVYYDKFGILKSLVPRLRIETRAGEISKGLTSKGVVYDYLKDKLRNLKGAKGCITLQLFVDLKEKSFKAIEINPRFGGGYPLSYSAGANFPRMLIQEYFLEEEVDFFQGLLGMDYAFRDGPDLTLEALYSSQKFNYLDLVSNLNSELYGNMTLSHFYLGMMMRYDLTIYLSGTLLYVESFNDENSRFIAPSLAYTLNDHTLFMAGAMINTGSEGSEFGMFGSSYYVKCVLSY
jgi:hypothetical protein